MDNLQKAGTAFLNRSRLFKYYKKITNPNASPIKAGFGFIEFGGDEEDRTLDLTDANRTLSQLSYAPTTKVIITFVT